MLLWLAAYQRYIFTGLLLKFGKQKNPSKNQIPGEFLFVFQFVPTDSTSCFDLLFRLCCNFALNFMFWLWVRLYVSILCTTALNFDYVFDFFLTCFWVAGQKINFGFQNFLGTFCLGNLQTDLTTGSPGLLIWNFLLFFVPLSSWLCI